MAEWEKTRALRKYLINVLFYITRSIHVESRSACLHCVGIITIYNILLAAVSILYKDMSCINIESRNFVIFFELVPTLISLVYHLYKLKSRWI